MLDHSIKMHSSTDEDIMAIDSEMQKLYQEEQELEVYQSSLRKQMEELAAHEIYSNYAYLTFDDIK